jgi:phospholipid N-methyltransferase
MGERWAFFQAFLKAPRTVASAIPSSSFLERRVVRTAGISDAGVVVELGAGTGGMTRAVLAAMRPDARLVSIERTDEFIPILQRIEDPRLDVVHGCASTIQQQLGRLGLDGCDAVFSGIPFSTLPPDVCDAIVAAIDESLRPDGRFVAYQFTDSVADYARPVMGDPVVRHEFRNIPPLKVFCWQKPAGTPAMGQASNKREQQPFLVHRNVD